MNEEKITQIILNHLRDEIIESIVTYCLLIGDSIEVAEDIVKYQLPDGLEAPRDYKIKIFNKTTGEIADRSNPIDQELSDILLLIECRRYMETQKRFLDQDTLKEFEEICQIMEKKGIKKN